MGEVRSETLDADELALLRAALRQALKPQAETSAWNSLAHAQVLDIALSSEQIALAAAVSEELGRVGAASPWAITRACARTFASASWFKTIVASGGYVAFADEDADATVAVSEGDDFKLVGRKKNVLHALGAARWIVSAKIEGVAALFLLMPDAQGCSVQRYDTIDGAEAVDIVFENVRVSASACIDGGRGAELCATLSAWLAVTWASERVGAMDALLAKTLAYVRERKQFGKALAEFQAVQQRLADMAIACEQARAAAARLAERAVARDGSSVHLQKKLALAARSVWQSAVQLHGGMGMTNDSAIARLIKRLIAIECSASHTEQLKGRDLAEIQATESFGALQPQPSDVSFRDEVRAFLADALQPDMQKAAQTTVGFVVEPQAGRAWTRKLYERGWVAPGWPKEFAPTSTPGR